MGAPAAEGVEVARGSSLFQPSGNAQLPPANQSPVGVGDPSGRPHVGGGDRSGRRLSAIAANVSMDWPPANHENAALVRRSVEMRRSTDEARRSSFDIHENQQSSPARELEMARGSSLFQPSNGGGMGVGGLGLHGARARLPSIASQDELRRSQEEPRSPSRLAPPNVRVGVGVLLCRPDTQEILVSRRRGSHGAGKHQLPGGHLEHGESWEECAVREVREETAIHLKLEDVKFAHVNNNVMVEEGKHYITIFMRCDVPAGTAAVNTEPDKCDGWFWVKWPEVPEPAFMPLQQLKHSGFQVFG